jgi:hypothetical protein
VQIIIMAILTAALLATAASFVVMGIRQKRHTRRLAGRAGEKGLHFSSDDPFDIPERYRRFALLSCGHSPRARNVTHGRLDALPLRAFEFHYEIGHGTRRTTCRYSAVIVDMQTEADDLMMWNHSDAQQAPLETRQVHGEVGCWSFRGSARLAQRLAQTAGGLAAEGLSLQVLGAEVLFCLPEAPSRGRDYFDWLNEAELLAEAIQRPEDSREPKLGG